MHILHVTPHLPPDQAANALLPWQLGNWASARGDTVEYVAHPPRATGSAPLAGDVASVPRKTASGLERALRIASLFSSVRIRRVLAPRLARADVVHVHSNGLLAELAVLFARRAGKPVVLTLYGTEIWHYEPKRIGPDLFTRAYREASYVTYYSDRLMTRAHELGLGRRDASVVYPPVSLDFSFHDEEAQAAERDAVNVTNRHLLLNVKRLHPLAGQRYLIEAMNEVVRVHPDARLVVCGTGALLGDLQAAARSFGVERHVTFAGLMDNTVVARYCAAADLFVLPSLLEALPTVAVEALASGTPVVSSDNPGGLELNELFGPDVTIVPRENAMALAGGIAHFLRNKRRTLPSTRVTIEREFRPAAVAEKYRAIYESLLTSKPDEPPLDANDRGRDEHDG
jgi:glycosyltransferase involved in cell wall biosynthesis